MRAVAFYSLAVLTSVSCRALDGETPSARVDALAERVCMDSDYFKGIKYKRAKKADGILYKQYEEPGISIVTIKGETEINYTVIISRQSFHKFDITKPFLNSLRELNTLLGEPHSKKPGRILYLSKEYENVQIEITFDGDTEPR